MQMMVVVSWIRAAMAATRMSQTVQVTRARPPEGLQEGPMR